MQLPDLINAVFEFGIGLLGWTNVRALMRDKHVKGTNWMVQFWVTAWGAFNLYYYPHLNQWLSFVGGLSIFGANTTWVGLYAYYTWFRNEQRRGQAEAQETFA